MKLLQADSVVFNGFYINAVSSHCDIPHQKQKESIVNRNSKIVNQITSAHLTIPGTDVDTLLRSYLKEVLLAPGHRGGRGYQPIW